MYKQHLVRQWFCGLSPITSHRVSRGQKPQFGVLCATSAVLMLAAPTVISLSESQVLAQPPISQDLETASFYQQGVTRYNRSDWTGAEYAFRQALQRDANIGMARYYLGNIFLMQNRLDVAVQEYGEAIRINPNLGEAYYNLGLALQRQGQKEAAITAYRQALVLEPTKADTHYNLGLALYEQGQLPEAIAAYEKAIEFDSSNANAHYNLAIALQESGKMPEAIATYQQVIKLEPQNAEAYSNLASLMVLQGQTTEAIAVYMQAIRQNPKNASAYYNLGVTLYNQGNLKTASAALKRAHKHYREQGNLEQAQKAEQLMQQIDQQIAAKKLHQQQASTANQTPKPTDNVTVVDTIAPTIEIPVTVEKQQLEPAFPSSIPSQTDNNEKDN
ncbi:MULTISPECIES: tetratricopeptide repeat protein [unclassified Anabaena]|uniref:tetratricopeptide repeat protein n=1 Tax=unclassified Anabaena TaxID=2619674 RepID=UPI00082E9484|nr:MULTISPECIES: tetratricopeptide repeat protein [unclassified Anabaena]